MSKEMKLRIDHEKGGTAKKEKGKLKKGGFFSTLFGTNTISKQSTDVPKSHKSQIIESALANTPQRQSCALGNFAHSQSVNLSVTKDNSNSKGRSISFNKDQMRSPNQSMKKVPNLAISSQTCSDPAATQANKVIVQPPNSARLNPTL